MSNKHKHKHYSEGNTPNVKSNQQNEDEQQEQETEEQKLENEQENAPVDPFASDEVEELHPPQDLNLKLQIEKENSIALTNMLKQLQADFENYRKRNANLKKESYDEGVFDVIKRMLNCYDAIEGALRSIEDEKVKDGIEILKREFLNAFKTFDVEPIEALNLPFDANLHNAVSSEEKEGIESGTVTQEIQKGFKSPDKVIRYSLVVIAK